MEPYKEFLRRIYEFEKEKPELGEGYFTANPSLSCKVRNDGSFNNFFGDTIVFNLDEKIKKRFADIADTIRNAAPECFAEKLKPETFHMTLHDLSSCADLSAILNDMFFNELDVARLSESIRPMTITMKTTYIFNMVNTSIVCGLAPVDEGEYKNLMRHYCLFDNVQRLKYCFTPHITLAYFRPDGFDRASSEKLERVIAELNKESFEFELDTRMLYYQKFTDMNSYTNIIKLA